MANRLETLNTIPFLDKRNCPPSRGEGKSVLHQHIQRSHVMSLHKKQMTKDRVMDHSHGKQEKLCQSDGLGMLRAPLERVWCGWCFGTTHFCLDAQPAMSLFPIPLWQKLWKHHSCSLCQEKGSTRKTPKPTNHGKSAFSECFGVFGKETQQDKQCGLWLWWSWSPTKGSWSSAKEPGGDLQRFPQDKLMEDLIPSQFKGSGSLWSETSVRVSTRRWNFYHHNFSHLRHYKFK